MGSGFLVVALHARWSTGLLNQFFWYCISLDEASHGHREKDGVVCVEAMM